MNSVFLTMSTRASCPRRNLLPPHDNHDHKGLLVHCDIIMREVPVVVRIKFMVGLEFLVVTYSVQPYENRSKGDGQCHNLANSIISPYFPYSIRCGERDFGKCAESKAPPTASTLCSVVLFRLR